MVGFKEIEIFGDFLKREFKANESKNIVVFARKT